MQQNVDICASTPPSKREIWAEQIWLVNSNTICSFVRIHATHGTDFGSILPSTTSNKTSESSLTLWTSARIEIYSKKAWRRWWSHPGVRSGSCVVVPFRKEFVISFLCSIPGNVFLAHTSSIIVHRSTKIITFSALRSHSKRRMKCISSP